MSSKVLCGVAGAVLVIVSAGCAGSNVSMNTNEQRKPFVRPLPGTQEYVRLLAKPESVSMHSGLVTLQPGEDCGWHSTENYEEMIVCLTGAGEVETEGGGRRALTVGQYAYNPPHLRHCVFNTGTQAMRYIYIVAPARFE